MKQDVSYYKIFQEISFHNPPFQIDIDLCILLDKRQQGVLHANNVYRLKTLDMAFDVAIDFQRWEEAIQFGKALMPGLT